jgi:hypothetical protein
MTSAARRNRANAQHLIAAGLAALVTGIAFAIAAPAHADSTPVGQLPAGPVSTTTTSPNQLVAVVLPHASKQSGFAWRIARRYDSSIVRQISEADIGANVVVVFKVVGRGNTSLVFAFTKGDTSSKAVKAVTHRIRSV